MIITNSRYALVGYFITSCLATRAHGIIVIGSFVRLQSTLTNIVRDIKFFTISVSQKRVSKVILNRVYSMSTLLVDFLRFITDFMLQRYHSVCLWSRHGPYFNERFLSRAKKPEANKNVQFRPLNWVPRMKFLMLQTIIQDPEFGWN